jgi:hypothetical protein
MNPVKSAINHNSNDFAGWYCGKCGTLCMFFENAEKCCMPAEDDAARESDKKEKEK